MRYFKLINSATSPETLDITTTELFFHDIAGLGFEEENDFRRVGSIWRLNSSIYRQKPITGKMCFTDNGDTTPYEKYKDFSDFIAETPLYICYFPHGIYGEEYRKSVRVNKLEKSEINKYGVIDSDIEFMPYTQWYTTVNSENDTSIDSVLPGWVWDIGNAWRDAETDNYEKTVEDRVVSFDDGHADLTTNIQWKNKNLLPTYTSEESYNGVAFTVNADGTVVANGTATATCNKSSTFIPSVTCEYTLTGCPSNGGSSSYQIWIRDEETGSTTRIEDLGSGSTGTLVKGKTYKVFLRIASGYTASNIMFRPMVRLASETDSTYEPYISDGSIVVSRSGKNLCAGLAESTYTSYGITFAFDGNHVQISGVSTATNVTCTNKTIGGTDRRPIVLEAGKTYTVSLSGTFEVTSGSYVRLFLQNGTTLKWYDNSDTGIWTVTPESTLIIDRIRFRIPANNTTVNIDAYMQIEEGTSATEYEEYNGVFDTLTVSDGAGSLSTITTKNGSNYIWAETGIVTVTYQDPLNADEVLYPFNTAQDYHSSVGSVTFDITVDDNTTGLIHVVGENTSASSGYSLAYKFPVDIPPGFYTLELVASGEDGSDYRSSIRYVDKYDESRKYLLLTDLTESSIIAPGIKYDVIVPNTEFLLMNFKVPAETSCNFYLQMKLTRLGTQRYKFKGEKSSTVTFDCVGSGLTRLIIYGPAVNPTWYHYVDDELISSGGFGSDTTLTETEKLIIDNTTGSFTMTVVDDNAGTERNVYSLRDFDKDCFITLRNGSNSISAASSNGTLLNIEVEGHIFYATV